MMDLGRHLVYEYLDLRGKHASRGPHLGVVGCRGGCSPQSQDDAAGHV